MDEQQSNNGFAITFTSVTVIILSIFIYLNARATFEPVKRRQVIASINASFPKVGEQGPDSLDGLFPIPKPLRDMQGSSRSERFGGVSARNSGGNVEVTRSDRSISILVDSDQLFLSSQLNPAWTKLFAELSEEVLRERWRVEIAVHESSDLGDDAWTRSLDRAQLLKTALAANGIPPEQLSAAAFGAQRPIASNDSPEGQRLNRRVEIRLSDSVEALR